MISRRYLFSLLLLAGWLVSYGSVYARNFGIDRLLYCKFESNRVVISLNKQIGGLCETSLQVLQDRIKELQDSIDRSILYARYSRDKRYWREVGEQLKSDVKSLIALKDQLVSSMETFKKSLFKQFQRLLYKHIAIKITQIERSFSVLDREFVHSKLSVVQEDQYMQEVIRLASMRSLLDMLKEQTTFDGVYEVREQLKQQF